MTGAQLRAARHRLGLTAEEMAIMLGYQGHNLRQVQYGLEAGHRTVREPQRRLTEAYLAGYRPADWPRHTET